MAKGLRFPQIQAIKMGRKKDKLQTSQTELNILDHQQCEKSRKNSKKIHKHVKIVTLGYVIILCVK
jgi:hypothetical protein